MSNPKERDLDLETDSLNKSNLNESKFDKSNEKED